jgi:hypothetical protein
MPNKTILRFRDAFTALAAAARAANAVDSGRRPQARDLRILDIDPHGFDRIRL